MFSKFSVKRPYTVIVGVVLIFILGVVTFTNMTVDLLPDMNLPYAMVMTVYPGASPEEVETTVTRPVEQAMATVSNINNIQSSSSENTSTVILEFDQTANMDSVTIEMRENLDQISGYWPEEIASPIIMKLNPSMMPVLIAAISAGGEDAARTSKVIEEQVIPELESIEGVASVTSVGSIEESVEITVNEKEIENLNDEVSAKLNQQFREAQNALEEAKAQAEQGRAALEAGQAQAAAQMGDAEAQISVKAEELKQAQFEITEKKAELQMGEAQISQGLLAVQAAKAGLQAQLGQLEALLQSEKELQAAYDALLMKAPEDMTEEETAQLAEIEAQLAEIQGQLAGMGGYDAAQAQLAKALEEAEQQEAEYQEQKEQLTAGMEQLELVQAQLNEGALTLAQARGQLSSGQIQAAAGISQGTAQMAAGETALAQQETQLETAKEEAYEKADMAGVLSADMVKTFLTAQNFRMPAGYVNEDGMDYLIRVGDKFDSIADIENLVLLELEGMGPVKLSDIATVKLVDNADETYAKINGESGVMLSIQKQTGYSTGDVSDRILEKLDSLEKEEGIGVKAVTLMDQGIYIDLIVNSVLQNLVYGAILAIIILFVFLKSVRPTFVIACSIPISILTALVAMYFSGVTLNIISLSGLALGVGMLVDNSIVVIENIYRMRNEEGASAKEAAVEGARQVSGAIAASTLTTVCVFVPIVFTKGITRQLFVDMGLTIAYSLLASLLVALTVVPMMSAGILKKARQQGESAFYGRVKEGYGKILGKVLTFRLPVLLGALVLFVASGALSLSRGTEFIPQMESTELSMTLQMPQDSTLEETAAVADEVMERVGKIPDIQDIGSMVGSTGLLGGSSVNEAEFYAITKEKAELNNAQLKDRIEEVTEGLDGELTVNTSSMDLSALGSSGIVVQIKGKDLDRLREIAGDIKEIVEGVEGTQNVLDGTEDSTQEFRVTVDKEKAIAHGLTVAQVYQELAGKLSEASAATALSSDTEEYDVYVKDDVNESMTREDVRNMTLEVTKQDGTTETVKLSDVAEFEDAKGLQAISRKEQSRYMAVTAEIAEGDNIGLVSGRVKEALEDYQPPEGYSIEMAGEDETINEAMTELLKMLGLAIVFMYLIMVAQFQSLLSPFIVMFTVPLAFTGGFLGLWLTGKPVSVIAMIGFVMLSGIIVNNGIVFVDYTNQLIESGLPQKEALIEAGRTRLRPIIMTALTTILGLSTMAAGVGMGSDMVQPMAIVTIGGLLYGTVLTLFVVPCVFSLFHREKHSRSENPPANNGFSA